MLSFLIVPAAWGRPSWKYSVEIDSSCLSGCAIPSLMGGPKVYMKRSFGVWNANLKYDNIIRWRVPYLVGYSLMVHFICCAPKESSVLVLFLAKYCVLHCVFIGLLLFLFKSWIFLIPPPFSNPSALLFISHLLLHTQNSLGSRGSQVWERNGEDYTIFC